METILIRTDSSSEIGTGHIMRSIVLAKKFSKNKIIFLVENLEGNINYKIQESGFELINLKSKKIEELISLIKKYEAKKLIVDHYDISFSDEQKIKKETGVVLFVLDDTYKEHFCDIILNHNIGADKKRYLNLVPKNTKIMCGQKYALIRDEFHKEKKILRQKNFKTKKIMLALGGADILNLNCKILNLMSTISNITLDITTTEANANLSDLKQMVKKYNYFAKLHINTDIMARLMNESNLIITTPSVTINEVFFMEKPFIAIKVADNQKIIFDYLDKNSYFTMNEYCDNVLKKYIKQILEI